MHVAKNQPQSQDCTVSGLAKVKAAMSSGAKGLLSYTAQELLKTINEVQDYRE